MTARNPDITGNHYPAGGGEGVIYVIRDKQYPPGRSPVEPPMSASRFPFYPFLSRRSGACAS